MKMIRIIQAGLTLLILTVSAQAQNYNEYLESKTPTTTDTGVPDCKRTTVTIYYCKDCTWIWEYVPFTCDCQPSDEYTATNTKSYPHISGSASITVDDQTHINAVIPKGATGVSVSLNESGTWTVKWDFCLYV
jgi:hypothetical protein